MNTPYTRTAFLTACTFAVACTSMTGRNVAELPPAGERIVFYSPHFDEPPPPQWEALRCPGGPVHAVGRAGVAIASDSAALLFTVRSNPRGGGGQLGEVLIPESVVHIKASISEGLERPYR